jgi:hypothetical protein
MIIKNCGTRKQWLCNVNKNQYVRTEIDWGDGTQNEINWHLNKDYVEGEIYLNEEELEEIFQKNNYKKNKV